MLITEKLYLLMAREPEKPESVVSAAGFGMNAAILSDLMIAGRVAFSDDAQRQIQLIGAGPCPDPVLASPLAKLEKRENLTLDDAVKIPSLCEPRLVTDSLAKAGIVEYGERTLLGLGKERVRIINGQIQRQIRADLQAALQGKRIPGTSDTTVLAILHALGIAHQVLEKELLPMSANEAQQRITELAQDSPAADSAQRAVAAMNAAITSHRVIPPAPGKK
ncbi:GOLPH3/VPS74 family protein [Glutamicibacter sp. TV12E]|uniref:GOLPH3/VPS74 family protein n=1 Tax=Glutamicibacter sp. TV12E TaxID=3446362 RepID=UPI00403429A5